MESLTREDTLRRGHCQLNPLRWWLLATIITCVSIGRVDAMPPSEPPLLDSSVWKVGPCEKKVVDFFRQYYPKYKPDAGADAEFDDEKPTDTWQERLLKNQELQSSFIKHYHEMTKLPSLPPVDAWDKAILSSTPDCPSCDDGCCDETDITLDCLTMNVPSSYVHTGPKSETIVLTAYRVRVTNPALTPANRTTLFLLQGGPGGPGISILPLAIPALQFASDIIVPDHRGTGLSTYVACKQQGSNADLNLQQVTGCASNLILLGKRSNIPLQDFTTSNAARDLAQMIMASRAQLESSSIFVHGYSYGTRWAQRFLQMYPNLADKVTIEGVTARNTTFNYFAVGSQYAGTRFMAKCGLDPVCRTFFPDLTLKATMDAIDKSASSNKCFQVGKSYFDASAPTDFIQHVFYKSLVQGITQVSDPSTSGYLDNRVLALALLARLQNCTEDNFRVFAAIWSYLQPLPSKLFEPAGSDEEIENEAGSGGLAYDPNSLSVFAESNNLIYMIIRFSEFWNYPTDSKPVFLDRTQNVYWGNVDKYKDYLSLATAWYKVRYPNDSYIGNSPANVGSKILIINGELDGQTPRSSAFQALDDLTTNAKATKSFAIIPDGGHGVTDFGCGLSIAKAFYHDAPLDLSCTIQHESDPIRPLGSPGGFDLSPEVANFLIGAPSIWSNAMSDSFCRTPAATGQTTSCARCLMFCMLTADDSNACQCVSEFYECLQTAAVAHPKGTCKKSVKALQQLGVLETCNVEKDCAPVATVSPGDSPKCKPSPDMTKKQCTALISNCGSSKPMKWAGQGCYRNNNPGRYLNDGGCQCQGYCGYKCAKACNQDASCTWNGKSRKCQVKATMKPGPVMQTC